MTQMDLLDWAPPRVVAFPHGRRVAVLRDIAETFVEYGYDAGNRRMMEHGWRLVAELLRLGLPPEEIGQEIDKFTAAARAAATRRLLAEDEHGGNAA